MPIHLPVEFKPLVDWFGNKNISDGQWKTLVDRTSNTPSSVLSAAVNRHLDTNKFFPHPSELLDHIRRIKNEMNFHSAENANEQSLPLEEQRMNWETRRAQRKTDRLSRPQCSQCGEHPVNLNECAFCADLEKMRRENAQSEAQFSTLAH